MAGADTTNGEKSTAEKPSALHSNDREDEPCELPKNTYLHGCALVLMVPSLIEGVFTAALDNNIIICEQAEQFPSSPSHLTRD